MNSNRQQVRFDHGAALRVPAPSDRKGWRALWAWLGDAAAIDDAGQIKVRTEEGLALARPGDWIVLSVSGFFHVARTSYAYDA